MHIHSNIYTLNHVLDVAAHGTNSSNLLLGSKPFFDHNFLAIHHTNVHSEMTEIAGEFSSWAANCDDTGAHFSSNALGKLHNLIAVDLSHLESTMEVEKITW